MLCLSCQLRRQSHRPPNPWVPCERPSLARTLLDMSRYHPVQIAWSTLAHPLSGSGQPSLQLWPPTPTALAGLSSACAITPILLPSLSCWCLSSSTWISRLLSYNNMHITSFTPAAAVLSLCIMLLPYV